MPNSVSARVKLSFVEYGTKRTGDKSGAYLFLPDGAAKVCFLKLYLGKCRISKSVYMQR